MLILKRTSNCVATTGVITTDVSNKRICYSLELPWNYNCKETSCIPTGTYRIAVIQHKKFGKCVHILGVPNRSGILIHAGNTIRDTHGCILVGNDIKYDYLKESKLGLANLISVIGNSHRFLQIVD